MRLTIVMAKHLMCHKFKRLVKVLGVKYNQCGYECYSTTRLMRYYFHCKACNLTYFILKSTL